MGHSAGNNGLLTEQSPSTPRNSSRKRRYSHHGRRNPKWRKVISSETETCTRIQTSKPDSTYTLNSCIRAQAECYDLTDQREERKPLKSSRTHTNRKWTYSAHDVPNSNDKVVIVSYNILGVENATRHPQLYKGVPPKYLDWGYRKKLLCKEVKSYRPSIMCFQEVDCFDDLKQNLGKDGFRGVHKARPGEACDGCAIFWKADLFTLLHEESLEFQRFGLRNNVAQFCVLKMNQGPAQADADQSPCSSTSRSLLVGNIHVLYNPKRGDIKLGQMRVFLAKAHELAQEWGRIPVVLTGDLNSLPQSAMYQFLASSELHVQQHDRTQISGQMFSSGYSESQYQRNYFGRPSKKRWNVEEIMLATGSRLGKLSHNLKLHSAYAEVPGNSKVRDRIGEPLATSYHSLFSGTVDYIWHTPDLLPVKVLETLPIHKLKKTGGLPSKKWGSDHLSLACELAFADKVD